MAEDTISAIATAVGEAAVGIIRISGSQSLPIATKLFRSKTGRSLLDYAHNTVIYGFIIDEQGRELDEVLVFYMLAPHSYTAENVVEMQSHGGYQSLLNILSLTYAAGARPAEPGEFTKRAFLNGRIDLAQAEAVMDIIQAKSKAALQLALQQEQGGLSREMEKQRKRLMDLVVALEAAIDYPEDDVEEITYTQVVATVGSVISELEYLLNKGQGGRIIREGLKAVMIGRPNVGKSSLLNMLLQQDRAIVSELPGTTRDTIEEQVVIDGIPLVLTDTAGLRATEDVVEQIGVERTKQALAQTDLAIVILDGSGDLTAEDQEILNEVAGKPYVIIINKSDLKQSLLLPSLAQENAPLGIFALSAVTGEGLDRFFIWLKQFVFGDKGLLQEGIYIRNVRHERAVRSALVSLNSANSAANDNLPYDCLIIDLREVMYKLGEITGAAVSDEIIEQIFARFCLGK